MLTAYQCPTALGQPSVCVYVAVSYSSSYPFYLSAYLPIYFLFFILPFH